MRSLLIWTATAGCLALLSVGINPLSSEVAGAPFSVAEPQDAKGAPELPRATVDTTIQRGSGRTIALKAGDDLQDALNTAKPGDRITLEPGATYRGPFRLPRKDGDRWIVITSAAAEASFPPAGRHVDPSHATLMPKLISSGDTVVSAEPGAHHYRFFGVEIAPAENAFVNTLVQLGADEKTAEALPHHIIIDRSYLHGSPKLGARRGVALNSRDTAIVGSYLSDFKEVGRDSQAIAGWNGAGPFRIADNYLEAAGENVMFGGADPAIPGLVPADIEVVHNQITKPLHWMSGRADFEGVKWAVKNLFELKNARRVLVDGNLFEYNWPDAQNGFAILFTVRNQDGGAPWSAVEDVTFVNNLVRHVAAGINVLGRDDNHPSQQVRRIAIRNNLFLDIGGAWGGGRLFQLLDGTAGISIDHNTAMQSGSILFGGDHDPHTAFVYQNNIAPHNEYGVTGSGTATATQTLARYFPLALFRKNVIIGGNPAQYPTDNFFPHSLEEIGLRGPRASEGRASLVRPYANSGTDGRDPGADVNQIARALSGITTVRLEDGFPSVTKKGDTGTGGVSGWIVAATAFWAPFALLGYVYLGYPLVAGLRARFQPKARLRAPIEPFVTVIVVAHNEADRIGARIENLLAQDYPADRLEIIIGSDGSSDDTVARARRYETFGVRVRPFSERRGKMAAINVLVPSARGEIVVFADARQRFDRNAIRALVANFADPTTGAVSGELVLTTNRDTVAAGEGTAFYWRYEKFIRATESRSGSMVGATGAIYAIRRDLFERIPDDTILDDVLIPLRMIRRGYRVVFEPEARAYDAAAATANGEFARKARTIAGSFQLFARERWLFNPMKNRLWFETISHKALRLAIPVFHAGLFAANLALADVWFYQATLAGQVLFYGAALVGWTQRDAQRRSFVVTVPYAMCLLGWATIVGFSRFLTDRQQVTWERVPVLSARRAGQVGRAA